MERIVAAMALDHVGIAVRDLDAALGLHVDALGMTELSREVMEHSGLEIVMLRGEAGGSLVELLAPIRADTAVSRFLDRRGPGLHHLAYRVIDIENAAANARERGLEMIGEIEPGAASSRTVFFHPRSAGGVLIEFVERASGDVQ